MIIYIINQYYVDMVLRIFQRWDTWNAKEIYQQGEHLYDFKEGRKFADNN